MITEKNNVFYCDCGFSWRRGMSGSHNCEDRLRAKLTDMAVQLANAESKCRELAAEVQAVRWACGQVYVKGYNHGHLNTVDRLPYADEKDLVMRGGEVLCEFTDPDHCGVAADAILAEVRASAIPEGYVLVPQQIFLDPSDIESICSQCGDGHESGYGDFTDGLLWVGNIQRDDGSIVHGLHISSADYTEEGGVTVCEFSAQLRKGDAL